MPESELGTKYKHVGWFCWICPVYMGEPNEGCDVAVRNWVPEWWLDFTEALFGTYVFLRCTIDPEYDPAYPFLITGDLVREE